MTENSSGVGDNMNVQTFIELGINGVLAQGLEKAGIRVPTKVQAEVIPEALAGRDVVGQSATGTGKTLAFLLPMFQNHLEEPLLH